MLSKSELEHLASILNVTSVEFLSEAQVIYLLAQRIDSLERQVQRNLHCY